MKKMKTLPVILLIIFGNFIAVKSNYNVSVGMTIPYNEIESIWDFEFNDEQSSGSGFSFEDVHYPNNTLMTVEVDSLSSSQVDYTQTVGAESRSDSNSHTSNGLGYSFLIYHPVFFASTLNPWNQTRFDLGQEIVTTFFIDHIHMKPLFEEWSDDEYLEAVFDKPQYVINRISGNYIIESSTTKYNYLLDCMIIGVSGLDTYAGNYTFQVVYDTQISIVLGFELYLNYSGYIDGDYYKTFHYYKAEKAGYDLPEFYYEVDITYTASSGFLVGTLISISALGFGFILIERKRRK